MSSEVVKKRGRPKKAVSEPDTPENIEAAKKATIRQKSTKALAPSTDKLAKAPATAAKGAIIPPKQVLKDASKGPQLPGAVFKPLPSSTTAAQTKATSEAVTPPTQTANANTPPKITPANSRILHQVRGLSSKTTTASEPSSIASETQSAPLRTSPTAIPKKSAVHSMPSSPPKTGAPPSHPNKAVPIAALNSTIVSQISSRAGARPGTKSPGDLPAGYRPIARRVTMTIVALPIAIVTSWVLYQRLVLGEERKQLVPPGMVMVDEESPEGAQTVDRPQKNA